jgi:hypothetical protein
MMLVLKMFREILRNSKCIHKLKLERNITIIDTL